MSPEQHAVSEAPRDRRALVPLLDVAFGFFIWAAHLLAIYITTALACVLGLGAAGTATRTGFAAGMIAFTVLTAGSVALHAYRRYRQLRDVRQYRFRLGVIAGCDAIATLAILWQTLPFLLIRLCA